MAPDHLHARANALFASDLSAECNPSRATVADAIGRATTLHGSIRGCVGEVAAAYGDHPETAAARMQWALQVIEKVYQPPLGSLSISAGQYCPFHCVY